MIGVGGGADAGPVGDESARSIAVLRRGREGVLIRFVCRSVLFVDG